MIDSKGTNSYEKDQKEKKIEVTNGVILKVKLVQ